MKRLTTEEFIKKAISVHGDKYDYSKTEYVNSRTKLTIICPTHGEFEQVPKDHTSGCGCQKCGRTSTQEILTHTTGEFIKKAISVHGDKYDYSKTVYTGAKNQIKITCPEHGDFEQSAGSHSTGGNGCPKCAGSEKLTTEEFIKKAISVHGDKYDYSKVMYNGRTQKVTIVCPEHGDFEQTPDAHFVSGCNRCGNAVIGNKLKLSTNSFIENAKQVHGNKYDYSKTVYTGAKNHITIICTEHGEFEQSAGHHHNSGHGCPRCSHSISKAEQSLAEYIQSLGVTVKQSYRPDWMNGKEIDIYMPDLKIGIEYNGLYFHSDKFKERTYHYDKTMLCNEHGVRLVHVWEDEDIDKVKLFFHDLIVKSEKVVYARKLVAKQIDVKTVASPFHDVYHIQSRGAASIAIGLYDHDKLVGVASFAKKNDSKYDLCRFSTITNTTVVGGLGKACKMLFKLRPDILEIISFYDRAKYQGHSYYNAGFVDDGVVAPDYKYVVNSTREHKFGYRKAAIRKRYPDTYFPESATEREMMETLEIPRIYDCGLVRVILNR